MLVNIIVSIYLFIAWYICTFIAILVYILHPVLNIILYNIIVWLNTAVYIADILYLYTNTIVTISTSVTTHGIKECS